ncbi:stage V sporulation protein AA [Romboutsia lituseburensis]|uniref:stage V sporulation protein AA n=1 Tax=Romboutsia lituseburensis TaxID=1537 RepID=UPI00215AE5F2|nr:stage V sporulation protein AA [Romboutsia lituseburensis]MCR8745522.1 stage V sporulation protein AA [Romboutsia lituseburensis]
MEDIYLIPKKITPFNITKSSIYLEDIYSVYPKEYENKMKKISLRNYKNNTSKYDVIHLGEIIEAVNNKHSDLRLNFLKPDDVIIFFDDLKIDKTKYLRVFIVSIVVLMGSIMGIMNFHADVNMAQSQFMMVNAITKDAKLYLPYFQLPYSIGIGIGVAIFFNKFIPTYSKGEPSPLDLKMISLNKEIENQLRKK